MTANEFLLDLLRSQTIGKDSIEAKDLKERRAEVENVLLREFGGDNPRIRYAGSYIKEDERCSASTTLAWTLSTPNRFIRDRATKALVALLTGRLPALWTSLSPLNSG